MQRNLEGLFWLSPYSHFLFFSSKEASILHLYSSVYSICFVLGSGTKGYGRHNALIISPKFHHLCAFEFEKRKLSRLWHVYRVPAVRNTPPEQILLTIDLYQLSTHILVAHTNVALRHDVSLSTCFQSLSRDYIRHVFFGDGREHTKKSQLQLLKNIAL